jgi:hypothetical protein
MGGPQLADRPAVDFFFGLQYALADSCSIILKHPAETRGPQEQPASSGRRRMVGPTFPSLALVGSELSLRRVRFWIFLFESKSSVTVCLCVCSARRVRVSAVGES